MASFQPKISWGRLRKCKKKKIVQMSSYPTRNRKFQKNSKKIHKIKKTPLWLLFKLKQVGKGREIEKIKIIIQINSYPTRNRKFQKNNQIGRAHV